MILHTAAPGARSRRQRRRGGRAVLPRQLPAAATALRATTRRRRAAGGGRGGALLKIPHPAVLKASIQAVHYAIAWLFFCYIGHGGDMDTQRASSSSFLRSSEIE